MEHTTSHSPKSHTTNSSPASTTVTTPDQSPGTDEDIWDTSSDHDQLGLIHSEQSEEAGGLVVPTGERRRGRGEILSDLPQLRRQHMTDGYREGLAVGKASVMQDGFDAGYPFGVQIGLRVGVVLGVLEGIVEGLRKSPPTTTTTPASSSSISSSSAGLRRSASASASASAGTQTTTTTTANTTTASKKNIAAVEGGSSSGRATDASCTDDATGKAAVPDIKFVEQLYEQAKRQLKISELLRGLDDEMVDRMGRVNSPNDPGTILTGERPGTNDENTQGLLPSAIEEIVARWEDTVLGSLAARTAQAEMASHVSGQHTDTQRTS